MYPLGPRNHQFADDLVPTGLGRRRSGRECVLCHQPIPRDDGFISEGICSICITPLRAEQTSRIRDAVDWLRTRSMSHRVEEPHPPGADVDEPRAA